MKYVGTFPDDPEELDLDHKIVLEQGRVNEHISELREGLSEEEFLSVISAIIKTYRDAEKIHNQNHKQEERC